ncbi:MAG: hypothetical protein LBI48_02055 [Burkholderiaceae bacterium]|jgi:hypothetical protein|nr:hypothetical protein [Burkholderiaceae bacterium]
MKSIAIVMALVCIVFISGCATPEQIQARQDGINQFRSTRPHCLSDEQCRRAWSGAQVWVSQNCGMKIQLATDSIIETYAARYGDLTLQCRVTKVPALGNGYIVNLDIGCQNYLGCTSDPLMKGLEFNQYVEGVMGEASSSSVASKPEPAANQDSEIQSDDKRCNTVQIKRMREANLTPEQITDICRK